MHISQVWMGLVAALGLVSHAVAEQDSCFWWVIANKGLEIHSSWSNESKTSSCWIKFNDAAGKYESPDCAANLIVHTDTAELEVQNTATYWNNNKTQRYTIQWNFYANMNQSKYQRSPTWPSCTDPNIACNGGKFYTSAGQCVF